MLFINIIIGVIIAVMLFESRSHFLLGCFTGGLMAYLLTKIARLQEKTISLEKSLQAAISTIRDSRSGSEQEDLEGEEAHRGFEEKTEQLVEPVAEKNNELLADTPIIHVDFSEPEYDLPRSESLAAQVAKTTKKEPLLEVWDIVISYFTGGNVVVRVGVIVLFFGVAFLLKYTIERNLVPIEFRLISICIGAIALLVFGWRLRLSMPEYALILQGAGVGILYLTIFAAMKLYMLIPLGLALTILVGLSVFSAFLAIIQNARSLAVIGITGGFLAPILTSTGSGNYIMLFSYYALLNTGILLTARYRSWRELNLLGFLFTFGIGLLWGSNNYRPDMFTTTEPFLILFFLFYVVIGLLFASNQPLQHKGYIDCTLIFGTPLVCFALQAVLVKPYEYGLAWSSLAMGCLYATLAWQVFKKGSDKMRTLVESFLAIGVVFGTVAIPLALDDRWTSAAWAMEGSAIVWIAIKQQRAIARVFGLLLQCLAGFAFLSALNEPTGTIAVINGFFLGSVLISLAGFFSSYCLYIKRENIETANVESFIALAWALLWWFGGGLHEIETFVHTDYKLAYVISFFSISGVLGFLVSEKLCWENLKHVYKSILPVLLIGAVYSLISFKSHPSVYGGYAVWPSAFIAFYWLLYRDDENFYTDGLKYLHLGAFLLFITLVTWETAWWMDHVVKGSGIWGLVPWAVMPAIFAMVLSKRHGTLAWPISAHKEAYLYHGLLPVVVFLWIGTIVTNLINKGDPWPLSYLPMLNPLDLAQAFVLIVIFFWALVIRNEFTIYPFNMSRINLFVIMGATFFLWLNAILIRSLHYWGGISFDLHSMATSDLVQTALSIFWTLSAFAIMLWGQRKIIRNVWIGGAALIGVVVIKLFIFDLSHTGTVERIVSFIGVGAICLLIGYLAPIPPHVQKTSEAE